jgi:PKD repeat protein
MTRFSSFVLRRLPSFLFVCLCAVVSLSAYGQADSSAVDITGEASVVVFDDFENNRSEIRFYIADEKSKREKQLHFSNEAPAYFETGKKVRVRGRGRPDESIDVESIEELDGSGEATGESQSTAAALAPPESRNILTLLVDFNDAVVTGGNYGTTVQEVRNRLYNESKNVAGLFFNSSLGTLTFEPDGDGDGQQDVFHVSINDSYIGGDSTQCSPSTWVNLASTAWQQANPGKDINIYRHRLLITPNYWDNGNRHCTWGGVAQVGCGSWCWAIGADPDTIMHGVIVHELGHNVGFNHARTDQNNNGYNSSESTDSEYGDNSDMMGSSRNWKKFNAPHAEDKGWIDPLDFEIRSVTPAVSAQNFDLLPIDDEAWDWPGLRALKLERSGNTDYYVTYRRASGDYNNLNSEYQNKVTIHYGFDNSTYSYFVTALSAGQSFTDPAQDLVIKATSPVTVSSGGLSTTAMGVEICRQNCSVTEAPSGLVASAQSTSAIDLDWNDNSDSEDGFDIERSEDGGAWLSLETVGPGLVSYTDTPLQSGMDYAYRVRASSPAGDSGWSNVATAKTLGIPPVSEFTFSTNYLQATFEDRSTDSDGTLASWSWDFGDGSGSTTRNPVHVYALPSSYTVNLEVMDEDGYSHTSSRQVTVFEAPNTPPTADFSFSVNHLEVQFTDTSVDPDGTVDGWLWDFGDSGVSTARNPSYTYASAGTYDVTLTTTDNDNDTHARTRQVTVTAPPAYVDYPAVGETLVAGTVSGSYLATVEDGGSVETIMERESGGKKSSRYSYLEHRWTFDIPSGTSASVLVNAWQSASSDGDGFELAWSTNGSDWRAMDGAVMASDGTPLSFDLDTGISGTVYVRAIDTNRDPLNLGLDILSVDYLAIRVRNGAAEPLAGSAPTQLVATAASHNSVLLTWSDNTGNEGGFRVERADGSGAFAEVMSTAPNSGATASFTDTGLSGNTTYRYRVRAFKGSEVTAYSNEASDTTDPAPQVSLSVNGYKVKGVQHADLLWSGTGTANVVIFRDGDPLPLIPEDAVDDGAHTDIIGNKGAGSYTYRVCETGDGAACSGEETIVF